MWFLNYYNISRDACYIYELGVMDSKPNIFIHLSMRAFNYIMLKVTGSQRKVWYHEKKHANKLV